MRSVCHFFPANSCLFVETQRSVVAGQRHNKWLVSEVLSEVFNWSLSFFQAFLDCLITEKFLISWSERSTSPDIFKSNCYSPGLFPLPYIFFVSFLLRMSLCCRILFISAHPFCILQFFQQLCSLNSFFVKWER